MNNVESLSWKQASESRSIIAGAANAKNSSFSSTVLLIYYSCNQDLNSGEFEFFIHSWESLESEWRRSGREKNLFPPACEIGETHINSKCSTAACSAIHSSIISLRSPRYGVWSSSNRAQVLIYLMSSSDYAITEKKVFKILQIFFRSFSHLIFALKKLFLN